MESTLPKAQFSKRHELIGNLSSSDYTADNLQIVLQYSQEQNGPILGRVIGNKETYNQLMQFFLRDTRRLKELYTSSDSHSVYRFKSSKVMLRHVENRYFDGTQRLFVYEVADLELQELTIQRDLELYDSENKSRYITFFLCGPRLLWFDTHMRVVSSTGSAEISSHESEIELETELPFKIHVAPYYLYESILEPTQRELTTSVLTLRFKTELPESDYSNLQFVEDAKAAADDLTLLVSFLSQRRITWFRYELLASSISEEYISTSHSCSNDELKHYDDLIDRPEVRPFLKKAFSKLRELREDNYNLLMPLSLFIVGGEDVYAENQFAIYFLALEKLKDMHSKKKKFDKNIGSSAFKRLSKNIRKTITDFLNTEGSGDLSSQIERKVPELNRPTLKFILESLFEEYDIQWNDLYPNNGEFTLIKTRDLLFHTSDMQEAEDFVDELERLRILVIRILLRMLGYEGMLPPPPTYLTS